MSPADNSFRDDMWAYHDEQLRDPAEVIAFWQGLPGIDPRLFEYQTQGEWWETLRRCEVTLLVTREYEHILLALRADRKTEATTTFMRIPHPSGIAADLSRKVVYVACTRNPNQIYDLVPLRSLMDRLDMEHTALDDNPLIPARTRFLPGCLYLHDLAILGGKLHATSVGQNAIIRLTPSGYHERVWWPKCIETADGPIFGQNHLQLNSIASGKSLETSFFSASTDEVTALRPGDPDFPVDRRGVIFSGETREAIARGLTRPHSARLQNGRIWVDNSGYGEVGYIEDGKFRCVARLDGWTRGLSICKDVMFVGTSRVLPRFSQYAPGVDIGASQCGLHAIDVSSGKMLGSIIWPFGNQIFAIDWLPAHLTSGLPFRPGVHPSGNREKLLFYAFQLGRSQEG